MLTGFWTAGKITDLYVANGAHDWKAIGLYPAAFAVLVSVLFSFSFGNEKLTCRAT
jgi:hypothetical protein